MDMQVAIIVVRQLECLWGFFCVFPQASGHSAGFPMSQESRQLPRCLWWTSWQQDRGPWCRNATLSSLKILFPHSCRLAIGIIALVLCFYYYRFSTRLCFTVLCKHYRGCFSHLSMHSKPPQKINGLKQHYFIISHDSVGCLGSPSAHNWSFPMLLHSAGKLAQSRAQPEHWYGWASLSVVLASLSKKNGRVWSFLHSICVARGQAPMCTCSSNLCLHHTCWCPPVHSKSHGQAQSQRGAGKSCASKRPCHWLIRMRRYSSRSPLGRGTTHLQVLEWVPLQRSQNSTEEWHWLDHPEASSDTDHVTSLWLFLQL